MADKQTYLDVHNGKREVRLPLPQAIESFVLGKGKDATFRLREHGLLDAHAKLSRDKVTGAWRLDALPGADFQLEGSPSSRQTAVVKVGQVATLSPNCFIRLTHEQPKLFERIMTTNKVGGKSPVIYAMTVLAIVSVPMFLLLALWPQQSTQKELDAHLTCGMFGNTAPLNETYTSRSWQYERLNGPSYYSCIQDTEAACKYTALSRSTMRSNVEMIANACASRFAISGSEDEVRASLRATLEGRISESQARLSELTPEDDEKRRIEASSIEQDQQRLSLLDQVCFSCRELEEPSDEELSALPDDAARSELFAEYRRKLLACEHGQEMADLFRRAGAARRGGRTSEARSFYQEAYRSSASPTCEGGKAAFFRGQELDLLNASQ